MTYPVIRIGKSWWKLGVLFLIAGLMLLFFLTSLLMIVTGAFWENPFAILSLLLLGPASWFLFFRPALGIANQPNPLITLGPEAVMFHHSGDFVPYERILAARAFNARGLTFLKLRLKPGAAVALKTHHIPLVSKRNPAEHERWDMFLMTAFVMSGKEIAAEIERRIPKKTG